MTRYIGIILISGAISMYGAYLSYRIKVSAKQRKALFELMLYIKTGIENGSVKLTDIYASFDNKHLEDCGFTELLHSASPDALSHALSESNIKMPEEMKNLYLDFASSIGKSSYKASALDVCARYTELIKAEENKISEKEEKKEQLYSKLGLLCGLLAALLLI